MDMQVLVLQLSCFFREKALHHAQGDLCAFFHHIPEFTGQQHTALAFGEQGLDVQHLPACRRPGKPCHNTGAGVFEHAPMADRMPIHEISEVVRMNGQLIMPAPYNGHRRLTAEAVQTLFQAAHSGFHGIFVNDFPKHFIIHHQILCPDAHALHGLWQQMPACYLKLVLRAVSLEMNHFHTVQQRFGNRVSGIGRADKHH